MKVRELIKHLSKCRPSAMVTVSLVSGPTDLPVLPVLEVFNAGDECSLIIREKKRKKQTADNVITFPDPNGGG